MNATFIETGNTRLPLKHRFSFSSVLTKLKMNAMIRAALRQHDEHRSITALSELAAHGLTDFQLARNETRRAVEFLLENEHISGAIHGHVKDVGGALVVATNRRLLYVHESPSFNQVDEIPFDSIISITANRSNRLLTTVCIHTKSHTYHIDYVNPRLAMRFIKNLQSSIPRISEPVVNFELICSA